MSKSHPEVIAELLSQSVNAALIENQVHLEERDDLAAADRRLLNSTRDLVAALSTFGPTMKTTALGTLADIMNDVVAIASMVVTSETGRQHLQVLQAHRARSAIKLPHAEDLDRIIGEEITRGTSDVQLNAVVHVRLEEAGHKIDIRTVQRATKRYQRASRPTTS